MKALRLIFLLSLFTAFLPEAMTAYQKQAGFKKHLESEDQYQKQRQKDFRKYKNQVKIYQAKQEKILEKRLKNLAVYRSLQRYQKKQRKLEKKWEQEQEKYRRTMAEARDGYILKRNIKALQDKKYKIKEFQFL